MPAHERFQLTAARRRLDGSARALLEHAAVSTHSRPKAAGALCGVFCAGRYVSTHSRPKAAGWGGVWIATQAGWFQLTAARRRLGQALKLAIGGQLKAGGGQLGIGVGLFFAFFKLGHGFLQLGVIQPPSGGCELKLFLTLSCLKIAKPAAFGRL